MTSPTFSDIIQFNILSAHAQNFVLVIKEKKERKLCVPGD